MLLLLSASAATAGLGHAHFCRTFDPPEQAFVRPAPQPPRPPDDDRELRGWFPPGPHQAFSEHFALHWGDGADGFDNSDADTLLRHLEAAWDVYVNDYGHSGPFGSDEYYVNVYIGES